MGCFSVGSYDALLSYSEGGTSRAAAIWSMLLIRPQTLHFSFEPSLTSCCCVVIQNTSAFGSLTFKIKTTAPEAYLVKPSRGVLPVGASTSIRVLLQPRRNPPSEAHHFLFEVGMPCKYNKLTKPSCFRCKVCCEKQPSSNSTQVTKHLASS